MADDDLLSTGTITVGPPLAAGGDAHLTEAERRGVAEGRYEASGLPTKTEREAAQADPLRPGGLDVQWYDEDGRDTRGRARRADAFAKARDRLARLNVAAATDIEAQAAFVEAVRTHPLLGYLDADGTKTFGPGASFGRENARRLKAALDGSDPAAMWDEEYRAWEAMTPEEREELAWGRRPFGERVAGAKAPVWKAPDAPTVYGPTFSAPEQPEPDPEERRRAAEAYGERLARRQRGAWFAAVSAGMSDIGNDWVRDALDSGKPDARALWLVPERDRGLALEAYRIMRGEADVNALTAGALGAAGQVANMTAGALGLAAYVWRTSGGRAPSTGPLRASLDAEYEMAAALEEAGRTVFKEYGFTGKAVQGLVASLPYMLAMSNPATGTLAALGMAEDARRRMVLEGVDGEVAAGVGLAVGAVNAWIEKIQWEQMTGGGMSEFELRRHGLAAFAKALKGRDVAAAARHAARGGAHGLKVWAEELSEEVLQGVSEEAGVQFAKGDLDMGGLAAAFAESLEESAPTTFAFGAVAGSGLGASARSAWRGMRGDSLTADDIGEIARRRLAALGAVEASRGEAGGRAAELISGLRDAWRSAPDRRGAAAALREGGLDDAGVAVLDDLFTAEAQVAGESAAFRKMYAAQELAADISPGAVLGISEAFTAAERVSSTETRATLRLADGTEAAVLFRLGDVGREAGPERFDAQLRQRVGDAAWEGMDEAGRDALRSQARTTSYFTMEGGGATLGADGIIMIAAPDGQGGGARMGDVYHEAFHAATLLARAAGVLDDARVATLRGVFGEGRAAGDLFDEEAAADAYAEWLAGRGRPDAAGKVWEAVRDFFRRVYAAVFGRPAARADGAWTAEDVFEALARGDVSAIPAARQGGGTPAAETVADAQADAPAAAPPRETPPADAAPGADGYLRKTVRRKDGTEGVMVFRKVPPAPPRADAADATAGAPADAGADGLAAALAADDGFTDGPGGDAAQDGAGASSGTAADGARAALELMAEGARGFSADAFLRSGMTPVIEALYQIGGVMSPAQAKAEASRKGRGLGAEYDGAPRTLGPFWNRFIYGGSRRPDQAAQELADAGVIADAYPDTLWSAVEADVAGYKRWREQGKDEAGDAAQAARFERDAVNPTAAAKERNTVWLPVSRLKVGDVVHVRGKSGGKVTDEKLAVARVDEATGEVELQDGRRYGRQELGGTEVIYAAKVTDAAGRKVDTARRGAGAKRYSLRDRAADPSLAWIRDYYDESWGRDAAGSRRDARELAAREYAAVEAAHTHPNGQRKESWMKAPNGKPTLLTARQWVQVRTPAFKAWFGDWESDPANASKVVDANGEPLVVYHGSDSAGFAAFDPPPQRTGKEIGHYFSRRPVTAATYSGVLKTVAAPGEAEVDGDGREREKYPGIYPVFLNIRNMAEWNFEGRKWNQHPEGNAWVVGTGTGGNWVPYYKGSEYGGDRPAVFDTQEEAERFLKWAQRGSDRNFSIRRSKSDTRDLAMRATEAGADGVLFRDVVDTGGLDPLDADGNPVYDDAVSFGDDVYMVASPGNIKSANANTGAFNPATPDIRYSLTAREGSGIIRGDENGKTDRQDKTRYADAPPESLTDEQRAEHAAISYRRRVAADGLDPALTSTFIPSGEPVALTHAEARAVARAAELFEAEVWRNDAAAEAGGDATYYVDEMIPFYDVRGARARYDVALEEDRAGLSFFFRPSGEPMYNVKFFELLDGIDPRLSERLAAEAFEPPHPQTARSLALAAEYFDGEDVARDLKGSVAVDTRYSLRLNGNPEDIAAAIAAAQMLRGKPVGAAAVGRMLEGMGVKAPAAEVIDRARAVTEGYRARVRQAAQSDRELIETLRRSAMERRFLARVDAAADVAFEEGGEEAAAAVRLRELQEKAVRREIEGAAGFAAAELELEYGVDFAEALLAARLAEPSGGAAADGADGADGDAPDLAAGGAGAQPLQGPPAPLSAAAKAAFEALSAKAAARAEADKAARERRRTRADDGEEGADGAEGRDGGGSAAWTGGDARPLARREGFAIQDAAHFRALLEEMVLARLAAREGFDAERPFGRPAALREFALTARHVLLELSRKLEPSGGREVTRLDIEKLAGYERLASLEGAIERVYERIHGQMIAETRERLVSKLERDIRRAAGAAGNWVPGGDEMRRRVAARTEEWARIVLGYLRLDDEALEAENARLDAVLDGRRAAGADADGYGLDFDRDYRQALDRKAALAAYGGLARLMPGEISDKSAEIMAQIEGGRAELEARRDAMEERTQRMANQFGAAVEDPAGRPVPDVGAWGRLADSLIGLMSLRMRNLIRFSRGETRKRAEAVLRDVEVMVAEAAELRAVYQLRAQEEMAAALKSIYGSNREAVRHLSEKLPDGVWQKVTNQGRRMTYGELLNLYASTIQRDYRTNAAVHGRDKQAASMREALTPQDMALLAWMRGWYRRNRAALDEALMPVMGVHVLSTGEDYMPVTPLLPKAGLPAAVRAWSPVPSSVTPRVRHRLDFDESADILGVWHSRVKDSASAVAFAETGLELAAVFGRGRVQERVARFHGKDALRKLMSHLTDTLRGGRADDVSEGGTAAADAARAWVSRFTLSGNIGTAIKQMVSAPVLALRADIGLRDVVRHMADIDIGAVRDMITSDGFKARYGAGASEEIANALKGDNPGWVRRLYNIGFAVPQFGDAVPGIWVGQGIYRARRAALEDSGMKPEEAKRRALTETWMMVEATQQSSRVENLNAIQRNGGGLGRLLYQFVSAPAQQLAYEVQAAQEALALKGAEGSGGRLLRALFINHVLVPALFTAATSVWRALLGFPDDEDDERFWTALGISMLIGPYSGMFMAGAAGEAGVKAFLSGKRDWRDRGLPVENIYDIIETLGITAHDVIVEWDAEKIRADLKRLLTSVSAPARHMMQAVENRSE